MARIVVFTGNDAGFIKKGELLSPALNMAKKMRELDEIEGMFVVGFCGENFEYDVEVFYLDDNEVDGAIASAQILESREHINYYHGDSCVLIVSDQDTLLN